MNNFLAKSSLYVKLPPILLLHVCYGAAARGSAAILFAAGSRLNVSFAARLEPHVEFS